MPNRTQVFCLALTVIACLLWVGQAAAKEMTAKEVVELKRLGFTDKEVIDEVVKTGTKLTLTADDEKRLIDAGAGEALIKALRNPPVEVTVEQVVKMVKQNVPVDQILDAIEASPTRPQLTAAQARGLLQQQVPAPVMTALRNKPLGRADLQALAEAKCPPAVVARLGKSLGYQDQPLTAAEARDLLQAGVPEAVLADYRKAGEEKKAQAEKKNAAEEKKAVAEKEKKANGEKGDQVAKEGEKAKEDEIRDEEMLRRERPAQWIGVWSGMMYGRTGFDIAVTMVLEEDGNYTLKNINGILGTGKWYVQRKTIFVMVPDDGVLERHSFKMTGNRVTIDCATGKLVLTRQQ